MKSTIDLPLGLPEFKILKQAIRGNKILLNIETHTHPERCPNCGFTALKKHDARFRRVRDFSLFKHMLYLWVHAKRFRCLNCREVFSESYDSIPQGKHQTHRLRQHVFDMCRDSTISHVSRQLKMSYKTTERIYYDIAKQTLTETKPSSVVGMMK